MARCRIAVRCVALRFKPPGRSPALLVTRKSLQSLECDHNLWDYFQPAGLGPFSAWL